MCSQQQQAEMPELPITLKNEHPVKKQKQKPTEPDDSGKLLHMSSMASEGVDATSSLPTPPLPPPLPPTLSYWDSTKAKKLFKPMADEENALKAIEEQKNLLDCATEAPQSYLTIIQHDGSGDEEAEEQMTECQKFVLHEK